jgi:hypothetical protein
MIWMPLLMGVPLLLLGVGEVFPSLTMWSCGICFCDAKKFRIHAVEYTSKRWTVGALEAARPLNSVWNGGSGGNVC